MLSLSHAAYERASPNVVLASLQLQVLLLHKTGMTVTFPGTNTSFVGERERWKYNSESRKTYSLVLLNS